MMESVASVYYFQRGNSDYPFAVGQLFHSLKNRIIKSGIINPKSTSYFVSDNRFGWLAEVNVQFSSDSFGSRVKYTTNSKGGRTIPKPKNPVGQILFIGGSYTSGYGVSDNESYPHILATEYWNKWEVQNMAVSGFGTHQAYMRLSDSIKSGRPPSVVIYGMIQNHIRRNYLRREWLGSIAPHKLPHFELMNGELVFKGTVGLSSGRENGPELRIKEIEMTAAYMNAMQKMCAEKNIPCLVIFLPPSPNYPLSLIYTLYKSKILFLDLGLLEFEGISKKDRHPNRIDHRRIATAIANSFVSDKLRNLKFQSSNR